MVKEDVIKRYFLKFTQKASICQQSSSPLKVVLKLVVPQLASQVKKLTLVGTMNSKLLPIGKGIDLPDSKTISIPQILPNHLILSLITVFLCNQKKKSFIFFYFFISPPIRNEIYIDSYKVHEKDERSFPKIQNLIKVRLDSSPIQW